MSVYFQVNSSRNILLLTEGIEVELKALDNEQPNSLNTRKNLYPRCIRLVLDFAKREFVPSEDCLPPTANIEIVEREKKVRATQKRREVLFEEVLLLREEKVGVFDFIPLSRENIVIVYRSLNPNKKCSGSDSLNLTVKNFKI
ncbi:hypothetical protein K7432_013941 [Basidiobolus ranarum]|uniref:Uncharacterized protein n=1 Tax=Basidiobolus ranarum TaxID=34480 RepID=A0ABR2WIE7_9FUNG